MKKNGLTLIELLSALSVTTILVFGAAPALFQFLAAQRLTNASLTLANALATARATAVHQQRTVTLWNVDGDWSSGMEIFLDTNSNGSRDNGEERLRAIGALSPVVVSGNYWLKSYVAYRRDGSAKSAGNAFQAGTFTLCSTGRSEARQLILSRGGRVRRASTQLETCP